MAKFDKYLTYKGNTVLLPSEFMVEGGKEKAIQLIQKHEYVRKVFQDLIPDKPNIPSFVKKALGI